MTQSPEPLPSTAEVRQALQTEPWHTPLGRLVREIIFGANDGIVTTLGFVAGISGALADNRTILVATLVEMIAGGFSMFMGGYISSKAQRDFFESEIRRERWEIIHKPADERDEIRQLYRAKGFEGAELESIVAHITSDEELWLQVMLEEELGLFPENFDPPLRSGALVGISFAAGAVIPLLPYLFTAGLAALVSSIVITAIALFGIGVAKTRLTNQGWLRSGLEMVVLAMLAAVVGYLVGRLAAVIFPEIPPIA